METKKDITLTKLKMIFFMFSLFFLENGQNRAMRHITFYRDKKNKKHKALLSRHVVHKKICTHQNIP